MLCSDGVRSVVCDKESAANDKDSIGNTTFLYDKTRNVQERAEMIKEWFRNLEPEVKNVYLLAENGGIPLAIVAAFVRAKGFDDCRLWQQYVYAPDTALYLALSKELGKTVSMMELLTRWRVRMRSPLRKCKSKTMLPESIFVFTE